MIDLEQLAYNSLTFANKINQGTKTMCINPAYYTHPEHLDHEPDPEDVSRSVIMTFEFKEEIYKIRGFWNDHTQEFWEAEYCLLDEDGNETRVKPSPELWAAADKAMINKTYEDMEEV